MCPIRRDRTRVGKTLQFLIGGNPDVECYRRHEYEKGAEREKSLLGLGFLRGDTASR